MAGSGGATPRTQPYHQPKGRVKMTVAEFQQLQTANRIRPASNPPEPSPAERARFLRENSTQTSMFSQGEDTPLFSGTAQRTEIDPFKKKLHARQERFDGGPAAVTQNTLGRSDDDYTPEYWENKKLYNRVASDPKYKDAADYKQAIKDEIADEATISREATKRGYSPGKMSEKEWGEVASSLKQDAVSELKGATKSGRESSGRRAVNRRRRGEDERQFVEVGGKTYEKRFKGGTQKSADEAAKRYNEQSKTKANDYMGKKLVDYGYSKTDVDHLTYSERRRLVAEISDGKSKPGKVGNLTASERQAVIDKVPDRDKEQAALVAANPKAGKGIETWRKYEIAALKAGKDPEPLPYQYLEETQ